MAKEGYVAINNPADLAKLKESEIFRDPASGKVYLKPKPTIKSTITANGHVYGIDERGNVLKDFGTAEQNKSRFTQTGTDENGNATYGFVDETTNKVVPAPDYSANTSSATFKDGSGITWNVAGWAANDATKVASMQRTADMIGKVDDSNIEQKVAQYTPGITADMVKKASELTGVSWEAIMTQVVQESTGGTSNVAVKNNNFGGLTFNNQEWIKEYGGTKGTARPASEGGNYIKFPTKQDGLNALAALQASYGKVSDSQYQSSNLTSAQQTALDIFNGTGSLSGVSTKNNLQARVGTELAKLKQQAIVSGDIEGLMRASAGGKDLDATTVTSLEKAVNVVGQIDDLSKVIDKEATGPIMGIIRSNNPYDSKAQLINAQLTAIVPNLARGIYGEVGVLTDNDVALYAKTLPNLKSTAEVKNLILGATIRSVQRSIENKMKIQAGAGRDVSGLIDTYKAVKSMADRLSGGASSNAVDFTQFYKQ